MTERKVVDFTEVKKELEKRQLKEKAKQKVSDALHWVDEHKVGIAIVAPMVIGATKFLVKNVATAHNHKVEADLKDLYIYDRSAGHYWKLKKKLTQTEWLELMELKEKYKEQFGSAAMGQALRDMKKI